MGSGEYSRHEVAENLREPTGKRVVRGRGDETVSRNGQPRSQAVEWGSGAGAEGAVGMDLLLVYPGVGRAIRLDTSHPLLHKYLPRCQRTLYFCGRIRSIPQLKTINDKHVVKANAGETQNLLVAIDDAMETLTDKRKLLMAQVRK